MDLFSAVGASFTAVTSKVMAEAALFSSPSLTVKPNPLFSTPLVFRTGVKVNKAISAVEMIWFKMTGSPSNSKKPDGGKVVILTLTIGLASTSV